MKKKRGGRRREGDKEKESGHEPPLYFLTRFATAFWLASSGGVAFVRV